MLGVTTTSSVSTHFPPPDTPGPPDTSPLCATSTESEPVSSPLGMGSPQALLNIHFLQGQIPRRITIKKPMDRISKQLSTGIAFSTRQTTTPRARLLGSQGCFLRQRLFLLRRVPSPRNCRLLSLVVHLHNLQSPLNRQLEHHQGYHSQARNLQWTQN